MPHIAMTFKFTPPTILLTVSIVFASAFAHQFGSKPVSDPFNCTDKWIHIRNLPSPFNLDLLTNCSEYPIYDDFCPYLENYGIGPKTHNRSHSWYRTDPYMLEVFFHRRMLEYPCLTPNPADAAGVFLPYYSGLDSLRYLYGPEVNSSAEHGLNLFEFLQQDSPRIWERNHGHDHFLMMARPAWDFSQSIDTDPPIWGTSFLELPEFFNVTALTLESRAWPWQDQAIPYPTSFHPPNLDLFESWIRRVRRSRRTIMAVFAGGGGVAATPNIRRSIRDECENTTAVDSLIDHSYEKACEIIDCSNGICQHDPIRYMKQMLKASFCLQPPGDTPTRRSTFDGILAGCIPVFFEEQSAKSQYTWHLEEEEYEDFSVLIKKEDVVFNGVRIMDVLMEIPREEVRRMRERVLEIMPRIMYRRHGSSLALRSKKDAFDIAVEGALQKIKSRLRELSVQ